MLFVESSAPAKVYVTQPVLPETIDVLRIAHAVRLNAEDRVLTKPELIDRLRDADAVVALLTDVIDGDVLEAAPRLKVAANVAVGFNNIDVSAATRLGIAVTNTPGVLTETSADFA